MYLNWNINFPQLQQGAHYKNTGHLTGANPLGNVKKSPGKHTFAKKFVRGGRSRNAPCRKLFARGYIPVKFVRGTPLYILIRTKKIFKILIFIFFTKV
jgi:hypothetical protein